MKIVLIIIGVLAAVPAGALAWFLIYKGLHPDWNPFL